MEYPSDGDADSRGVPTKNESEKLSLRSGEFFVNKGLSRGAVFPILLSEDKPFSTPLGSRERGPPPTFPALPTPSPGEVVFDDTARFTRATICVPDFLRSISAYIRGVYPYMEAPMRTSKVMSSCLLIAALTASLIFAGVGTSFARSPAYCDGYARNYASSYANGGGNVVGGAMGGAALEAFLGRSPVRRPQARDWRGSGRAGRRGGLGK